MNATRNFFNGFLDRHQDKLWWFHSSYSLLLGIGVMWLGAKHFAYLRLAVFHIAFIWVSSLFLPLLAKIRRLPEKWRRRLCLLVNYFQRNFYQQLLFFILPVYYQSATWGAGNMLFVILLAVSALLATMDIVYDRHLSVNGWLLAAFFAFNLFACINVMLPVIWNFKNAFALRLSALLALAGFASFAFTLPGAKTRQRWRLFLIAVLLLAALSEAGRALVPPVPLRLAKSGFATGWNEREKELAGALSALPAGDPRRIYVLTAIRAPLGLKERVGHRWYLDGRRIYESPYIRLSGGRSEGFRLWTFRTLTAVGPGSLLRVDVRTEAGQLIGRACIRAGGD
ncbi:MAG: DUF2914 domain-containing protein [Acidobacteria bacterium]|jgi:hypothetical protein|nr:DUF2914 domain-containing protein [Acidobacteriota bacterium]